MVNVTKPESPVQKRGLWPPRHSVEYVVKDDDDWWRVAKRFHIKVWDLIEFNFKTRRPEEVNWYLKELVGCRVSTDGYNYAFKGASKRKIYRPVTQVPDEPLPPNKSFDQKLQNVYIEIMNWKKNGKDPRLPHYECMLFAIQNGYDDRVIQWVHIAPDAQTPVGIGVARRGLGSTAVDPQWFHNTIKSAEDVDSQPFGNGVGGGKKFVTSVRQFINDFEPSLTLFRSLHDQILATHLNMDLMADGGGVGGNTSMPPEYLAVRDWIKRQERDPKSILNCVTTTGTKSS